MDVRFVPILLALTADAVAAPVTIDGYTIRDFDKSSFSQTPTACDRQAAFDIDRDRVSDGVPRSAIDIDATIAACKSDLSRDPTNPRLNYQIARIYGYKGDMATAERHRRIAVEAGYPMAIFSVAYLRAFGPEASRDRCQGRLLMRQAARAGAFSAEVGYTAYVLSGSFTACPDATADKAELSAFITAAKPKAQGHIEELLVESLTREVGRLP